MYCKNCRFRSIPVDPEEPSICQSPKISELTYESDGYKRNGDRLLYSYEEDGRFYVEDNFGCVHFEEMEKILYGCGYVNGESYGMFAGPHPSLEEMESYTPEESSLDAVIIRLSDSAVVRVWDRESDNWIVNPIK